jgi:hypothetical protein
VEERDWECALALEDESSTVPLDATRCESLHLLEIGQLAALVPAEEPLDASRELVETQSLQVFADMAAETVPALDLGRQGVHSNKVSPESALDQHRALPLHLVLLPPPSAANVTAIVARDDGRFLLSPEILLVIEPLYFAGQEMSRLIEEK